MSNQKIMQALIKGSLVGAIFFISIASNYFGPDQEGPHKDGSEPDSEMTGPATMVDRLAIPILPENPTQYDVGDNLYYYHCMPCHGDYGQGLTNEFRKVWVEDHQNCWTDKCHGGGRADGAFPVPRYIPPVIGLESSRTLVKFSGAEDLYTYLSSSHPPQNPGVLEEDEYWALTTYLFAENGRITPDTELGPYSKMLPVYLAGGVVLLVLILLGVFLFLVRGKKTKKLSETHPMENGEQQS